MQITAASNHPVCSRDRSNIHVTAAMNAMRILVAQRDNDRRLVADATKDALGEAPTYREISPGMPSSGSNTQK